MVDQMVHRGGVLIERRIYRRHEDLTLLEQAEQGRLSRALLDSAADGIVGLSAEGAVLCWNRAAERILGHSEAELKGKDIGSAMHFDDRWWSHGARHWEGAQRHRDGRSLHLTIDSSVVLDGTGRPPIGLVWIVRDVTDQMRFVCYLQQRHARLEEEARTDLLTGVANRRRLCEVLRTEMSRARRSGACLSLLLVDLDHLKAINDGYSHAIGDAALKAFARAVKMQLRSCDLLARIGGDEFAVVMPDTSRHEAAASAARMQAALSQSEVPGFPGRLTISVGIAEHRSGESQKLLLQRADEALYQAKKNGRDRAVHWDDLK